LKIDLIDFSEPDDMRVFDWKEKEFAQEETSGEMCI
jgi:hypothetical protein